MVTLYITSLRLPTSLTTNDEHLIVSTPNDSIMFHDDFFMEIAQYGINTSMYLPNFLFIDEVHQYSSDFIQLEEEW